MASDHKNLTGKGAKLTIEPLFDTNWSDMPDDIKLECIGKMELKERLSLRCTAKAERSLVDSQKIKCTTGLFWGDDAALSFDFSPVIFPNKYNFSPIFMRETFESMKYVKKIGVFENLTFSLAYPFRLQENFFTDDEFFKAKNIKFNMFEGVLVVPFLRKMNDGVESIKIDKGLSDELGEVLAIPIVQNVPYWHIQYYNKTDSLHKVGQMWIDTNARIGSNFQVSVSEDGSFEEFLERFDDRIVSTSEKRARIRTNDPDRHILLERGLDDVVTITYHLQFFRLIVISAEMKESDYSDDCKEWICKINSHAYDRYDSDNSSDNHDDFHHDDYQDYDIYDSDW